MKAEAAKKRSLGRRFGALIAFIGLLGIGLALVSDRPSIGSGEGYWDALREIGGAVVAGALLAGLVVWFEDRREDERIDREETREQARFDREQAREDAAARSAWQREIDIKLVSLLTVDLADARIDRIADLEAETRERQFSITEIAAQDLAGRPFGDIHAEIDSLLRFRRDPALESAWIRWNIADDRLLEVPPPSRPEPEPSRRQSIRITPANHMTEPATRDPDLLEIAVSGETEAWEQLVEVVENHIDSHYPLD